MVQRSLLFLSIALLSAAAPAAAHPGHNHSVDDTARPIAPGKIGERPFWNKHALRYIYAPAFEFAPLPNAVAYRFTLVNKDNDVSHHFNAESPDAPLSPVWNDLPEGETTLKVEAYDAEGQLLGTAGEARFYKSPGFSGDVARPARPYDEAARDGLRAIFLKPHVQTWLTEGTYDPTYARYCYPNKIMGALASAMAAYSQSAASDADRTAALTMATRIADHLLTIRYADGAAYAGVPPTYVLDVDQPMPFIHDRVRDRWLMTPSTVDAAFAFLDVYAVTKEQKFLDAAVTIADALLRNQAADGTWPLMADWKTGEPVAPQRLVPTSIIFLYDRLHRDHKLDRFQASRDKAWQWIEEHPLKTFQWDAQFEDVKPRGPYENLAREQACDVAELLLSKPQVTPEEIEKAKDLLRFAEDQFVVWSPVEHPDSWRRVMPKRRKNMRHWILPGVLEQYVCYDPVARSSAILISAYLKMFDVTGERVYLDKAHAMANALVDAQQWFAEQHEGNGEIPTWLRRNNPTNWLNNAYYAAKALERVSTAPHE